MTKRNESYRIRRLARALPETWNAEARTIEIVWSTGAEVVRHPFFGEPFVERLSMAEGAVDLGRLQNRAQVLDSHWAWSVRDVLGVVETAELDSAAGEGRAGVRFSKRDEIADIVADVADGILGKWSVGYNVNEWRETPADAKSGSMMIREAVQWEPLELSLVPIAADDGVGMRSGQLSRAQRAKDPEQWRDCDGVVCGFAGRFPWVDQVRQPASRTAQRRAQTDLTGDNMSCRRCDVESCQGTCGERSAAQSEAIRRASDEAAAAERIRVSGIRSAGDQAAHFLGDAEAKRLAVEFVDQGVTLDAARAKFFDLTAAKDEADRVAGGVRVELGDRTEEGTRCGRMRNALLHRSNPAQHPIDSFEDPNGTARFVGRSLLEMGRMELEARGINTDGLSAMRLAKLCLIPRVSEEERLMMPRDKRLGGLLTVADFPGLLIDAADKNLRRGYMEANGTWRLFTTQATARDFKTRHNLQMGHAPSLDPLTEHGEFQSGSVGEGHETYALDTFGKIVGITRRVLVNDDLRAFTRMPQLLGAAGDRLHADIVFALLTTNPNLFDGAPVFNVAGGRDNDIGAGGGAPTIAQIGAMRRLMRRQTGIIADATDPNEAPVHIDVRPGIIIAPTSYETEIDQLQDQRQLAETAANVVPSYIRSLIAITEPRLDDASEDQWYMLASPGQYDTIEWATLEGEEPISSEIEIGFEVDGIAWRARSDFGAGWQDHRGATRNSGTP